MSEKKLDEVLEQIEMINSKICNLCGIEKTLTDFHKDGWGRALYHKRCKECRNKINRKRYHEKGKKLYNTVEGKIKQLLNNIRCRSKKRNLEFDLDYDFLTDLWDRNDGCCAITGLKFSLTNTKKYSGDGPSLDRINSDGGYTKDNVQWIIGWVNFMKSDMNMQEFQKKISLLNSKLNHF